MKSNMHRCPICRSEVTIVKEEIRPPDGYCHDMWHIFCRGCGFLSRRYPADNFFEEFNRPYYETEEEALNKFDEECKFYAKAHLNEIINSIKEVI